MMEDFNLVSSASLNREEEIVVVEDFQDSLNQQLNSQIIGQIRSEGHVSLVEGGNWPGNVMYILNREPSEDVGKTVEPEDENVTLIEIKKDEDFVVNVESGKKEEKTALGMCTRLRAKGATRPPYSSSVMKQSVTLPVIKQKKGKKVLKDKGSQAVVTDPMTEIALKWYKDQTLCDVTLISGDEQVQAHSLVLASNSSLLHAMLTTDYDSENHRLVVDHLKLAPGCLKTLVNYMYTKTLQIDASNQLDLIFAAGMLSMEDVTEELIKKYSSGDCNLANSGTVKQRATEDEAEVHAENVGDGGKEGEEAMDLEDKREEDLQGKIAVTEDLMNDSIQSAPLMDGDDADVDDSDAWTPRKMESQSDEVKEEAQTKRRTSGRPKKYAIFHEMKGQDGRYHCNFEACNYSSGPLCNLVRHYRIHSNEKPFSCSHCGKAFKLRKYVVDHERTHSEKREFECNSCEAKFRAEKHLKRHQKTHTAKPYFLCQICNQKKFKTEEMLQKHISIVHLKEKTFACPEEGCTYKGLTAALLKNHSVQHSDSRQTIICETCGKSFLSEQSLRHHVDAVHQDIAFQCPHCPYKSGFRTGISSHIKRKHGLTLEGTVASPNYQCDQCEYSCFTKHEFTRHMRNHTGEKPFKCPICDFATVEKMNLKFHLRTHTGEKPYECSICHRTFPRTLGLRRHMLVHSGHKPHKCNQCDMAYADKRSLESHQYSTHLQIKPFVCPHCAYACIRRENLTRHMRRSHPVSQEPMKIDGVDPLFVVKREESQATPEVSIGGTQPMQQVFATNQLGEPINLVFGPDHQLDTVQLVLQQQQHQ